MDPKEKLVTLFFIGSLIISLIDFLSPQYRSLLENFIELNALIAVLTGGIHFIKIVGFALIYTRLAAEKDIFEVI